MQSTSNGFIVHSVVQNRINNLVQGSLERSIVSRCVGGYSASRGIDSIAKIRYRWSEHKKLYSDWKQSCEFLDNRKVRWLVTGDDNPTLELSFNLFAAPWIALDYISQESGEDQLRKLIHENNNLTSKKI